MSRKLTEMTLDELHEKHKKLKSPVMGLGIALVAINIILLFLSVKTKNFALIAVVVGTSMSLLPGITQLGQINTEIKSRGGE